MAEYEVDQIRRLQPEGPYYVAGFCAGAAIAFESARQLHSDGRGRGARSAVRQPVSGCLPCRPSGHPQARALRRRVRRHAPALIAGSVADRIQYLRGGVQNRRSAVAERRDPSLTNRRRLEEGTVAAVKRYDTGCYDGRVDLFLPSHAWRHFPPASGQTNGSGCQLASSSHVGPDAADGDNMLKEPHVRVLAPSLNESLRDETRQHAVG